MEVMDEEKNRKWSVATYGSIHDELKAMGENYGKLSLHFNTAAMMFALSPEDVRETWIAIFERARRMEDGRTIVERVRSLAIAAELIPDPEAEKPLPDASRTGPRSRGRFGPDGSRQSGKPPSSPGSDRLADRRAG